MDERSPDAATARPSLADDAEPSRANTLKREEPRADALAATSRPATEAVDQASADRALPREHPGRYSAIGERGRGGYGRVLVAFDQTLQREVALKELIAGEARGVSEADQARFVREARLAGRLEHPNIVPVYELGQTDSGAPYYTMRLVRGRTLEEALRACRAPGERLRSLKNFWDLCGAIAFAHSRGVIHRDLKPQNVMVGEFGETVVLDWGLAKAREAERPPGDDTLPRPSAPSQLKSGETVLGQALGTPAYMSPEQVRGVADERSDVWGLGAVLYEILTGRPPFAGASVSETLAQAERAQLAPVRARCPWVRPELAAIAQRALQPDPRERYPTARALADDVEAFMTGGRVAAYRYRPWEQAWRFAREHKVALGFLCVLVLSLVAVSAALRQERQARAREGAALQGELQARARERVERLRAELQLAAAYVERSERLLDAFRYTEAFASAARALAHNPAHPRSPSHSPDFARDHPESRGLRVRAASAASQAALHFWLEPGPTFATPEAVGMVCFSPDGRQLAAAVYDGSVRLWDVAGGPPRVLRADAGVAYSVAFSPDGERIAVGGFAGKVTLWAVQEEALLATLEGLEGTVRALAFSPDGSLLAAGGLDGRILLWRPGEAGAPRTLRGHAAGVRGLAFAPDGRTLLSAGLDGRLLRHEVQRGDAATPIARLELPVQALALSPDGARAATAGMERAVRVTDVAGRLPALVLEGNERGVRQLAWSRDGRLLASAGEDGTVRLFRARAGEPAATVEAHSGVVTSVAFSADGERLVTAGFDRTVRVWRIGQSPLVSLAADASPLYSVAWSADGARLAAASRDRQLRVWDVARRAPEATWGWQPLSVGPVAWRGDGALLAVASGHAEIFRADTGASVRRLPAKMANRARFSPDGRLLAVGEDSGRVGLWSPETGELLAALEGHADMVFDLAFAADGALLASVGKDATVRLWSVADRRPVRTLKLHEDWGSSVSFAADGRLATAGKDGRIVVWDPASWEPRAQVRLQAWVRQALFSPDGKLLASNSDDRTVRLWDAASLEPLALFRVPDDAAEIAFRPDGRALAVASGSSALLVPIDLSMLEADPEELLARARALGFRSAAGD